MHAKRADSNQALIVDALRAVGCEVFDLHKAGGGVPDLLVCTRAFGRALVYLVEVKRPGYKPPVKRKPTNTERLQAEFARRFPVHRVTNVNEALAAVGVTLVPVG